MRRGFTLVELMIVVAIIGILAAMAIPNFIIFQAKSKQSEAKTNLKAIFASEKTHFAEADTYGNFSGIGFAPERGNRYAYTVQTPVGESQSRVTSVEPDKTTLLGFDQIQVDCYRLLGGPCSAVTPAAPIPGGAVAYAQPTMIPEPGVTTPPLSPGLVTGQSGSAVARAVGNVDNDSGNDAWEVGMALSLTIPPGICGETYSAPSGQPINSWNDTICD